MSVDIRSTHCVESWVGLVSLHLSEVTAETNFHGSPPTTHLATSFEMYSCTLVQPVTKCCTTEASLGRFALGTSFVCSLDVHTVGGCVHIQGNSVHSIRVCACPQGPCVHCCTYLLVFPLALIGSCGVRCMSGCTTPPPHVLRCGPARPGAVATVCGSGPEVSEVWPFRAHLQENGSFERRTFVGRRPRSPYRGVPPGGVDPSNRHGACSSSSFDQSCTSCALLHSCSSLRLPEHRLRTHTLICTLLLASCRCFV